MMTVFILIDYDNGEVCGAYETLETANAEAMKQGLRKFYIQEYTIGTADVPSRFTETH